MPQPRSSRRWTRLLLLAALLLVAVVTSGAFAEPGAVVAVAAQDDATDEKESAAVRSTHKREKVPEFVPTSEWQELLPGQGIPKVPANALLRCEE
jgi:C4-dicarboxylate-specific signal transduction histidine kinase